MMTDVGQRGRKATKKPTHPKLPLVPGNQHLRDMRDVEERQVPTPHALLPVLRGDVVPRPKRALLEPEPGNQHLAERQRLHAIAVLGRDGVRIIRAPVLGVQVEGPVAQLRHQLDDIVRVRLRVVTVCCWRFVRIPESAQVGGHDAEVWCEEWHQLVPVEAVLGRAVQEEQRFLPDARGDVVHSDAVDAGATVFDGRAGVVVCFCEFAHVGFGGFFFRRAAGWRFVPRE